MKALLHCETTGGKRGYREIDVLPVVIPGIDYPYLVVHNVLSERSIIKWAYTISDYKTGLRIGPFVDIAHSPQEAVSLCYAIITKRGGAEVFNRARQQAADELGEVNKIDPADWTN